MVDYAVVIGLVEILVYWYVTANVIGASLGAITNFLIGRYWAFQSATDSIAGQAGRYVLVSLGSLILNTLGLYLLTEYSPLNYIWAKVLVALFIAVTYNYLMQKKFVFRK